jgi:hypothetical protein
MSVKIELAVRMMDAAMHQDAGQVLRKNAANHVLDAFDLPVSAIDACWHCHTNESVDRRFDIARALVRAWRTGREDAGGGQ